MKKLLKGYKKVIGVVGRANTILILTIIYWAILPIFYLLLNFKRESMSGSTWRNKEKEFLNSHEQQF
ncbi:MAG: hypothetical protein Q7S32_00860 [bacterium]|nr:hypothetical protein [bacterium]